MRNVPGLVVLTSIAAIGLLSACGDDPAADNPAGSASASSASSSSGSTGGSSSASTGPASSATGTGGGGGGALSTWLLFALAVTVLWSRRRRMAQSFV